MTKAFLLVRGRLTSNNIAVDISLYGINMMQCFNTVENFVGVATGSKSKRFCARAWFQNRFGDELGEKVWEACNAVFDRLPLAGVVDHDIFCVHGGIPRPLPGSTSRIQVQCAAVPAHDLARPCTPPGQTLDLRVRVSILALELD